MARTEMFKFRLSKTDAALLRRIARLERISRGELLRRLINAAPAKGKLS